MELEIWNDDGFKIVYQKSRLKIRSQEVCFSWVASFPVTIWLLQRDLLHLETTNTLYTLPERIISFMGWTEVLYKLRKELVPSFKRFSDFFTNFIKIICFIFEISCSLQPRTCLSSECTTEE